MGHTAWFRVERSNSPLNDRADHSLICQLGEHLDRLAVEGDRKPLTSFFDHSELAAQYGGPELEVQWFDPREGLATVDGILRSLEKSPEELSFPEKSRAHWRAAVLEELRAARAFLTKAADAEERFHFFIVP